MLRAFRMQFAQTMHMGVVFIQPSKWSCFQWDRWTTSIALATQSQSGFVCVCKLEMGNLNSTSTSEEFPWRGATITATETNYFIVDRVNGPDFSYIIYNCQSISTNNFSVKQQKAVFVLPWASWFSVMISALLFSGELCYVPHKLSNETYDSCTWQLAELLKTTCWDLFQVELTRNIQLLLILIELIPDFNCCIWFLLLFY